MRGVTAFPAEHEIGLQREDPFDIEPRSIADLRQPRSLSRVVTVPNDRREPTACAGRVNDLGKMRGQRDDAERRRRYRYLDAAVVFPLARERRNVQRGKQKSRAAQKARHHETGG